MFCMTGAIMACALMAADLGPVFPPELVNFVPYGKNPIFEAAGPGHWDEKIRERGWIMKEDGTYHMWYTGYDSKTKPRKMGYATSPDGITWTRYPGNPIYTENWIEDMMVVKVEGTYYMFAEGENDHAQLLTSTDRIHWTCKGTLDIRKPNGEPIPPGPFGTPAAIYDNGAWYLLYERHDEAVWLAKSTDLKVWTNVQDEPVFRPGPEPYDRTMIAINQILKYQGRYYIYYHGLCPENGEDTWNLNVAVSPDLIHWQKYPGNPVIKPNHSSGIIVDDGTQLRLYCMHPSVWLFYPPKK